MSGVKPKTLVVRLQPPRQQMVVVQPNPEPNQVPEKESVEEQEEHGNEWPTHDDEAAPRTTTIILPNTSSSSPSTFPLGKRKRKPKEIQDDISPIIPRKKKNSSSSKSKQVLNGGARPGEGSSTAIQPPPVPQKSPTMIRAEEIQASLGNEYPSFLKTLVRSNVASCFWMGLPVPFCKQYLPRKDTTVTVEDEDGKIFEVKYFAEKNGLSAGWRKYIGAHKLVEGDVLIFQLIDYAKFKIHVIKSHDMTEVDGALSLLNLDAQQTDPEVIKNKKRPKSLPSTLLRKKKTKADFSRSDAPSDEVASEVSGGFQIPPCFRDLKTFDDFHVVINGVCVYSELPEDIRRKYYKLCCSKKSYLHDRLLPGLYCKLAAGMIFEFVNTVETIRGCKLTTARRDFEIWDKSLRSFELLGMNVGFVRARLDKLISLAFDSEGASETKKYWDAKIERVQYEEEIMCLEAKLVGLKEASEKCDEEIENLRSKAESYEVLFQEEVNAPW